MENKFTGLSSFRTIFNYQAKPTTKPQEPPYSEPTETSAKQAEIHRLFGGDSKPKPEELQRSAAIALLAQNPTPEKQTAKEVLARIDCFKTLADYCNAVHEILVKQRHSLDHAALYELAVKAVAHIDKIGQNLVDVIMPKNIQEWRVFAEEMAVHFLNLPLDLAKHRHKA